jgi:hypothetical protein
MSRMIDLIRASALPSNVMMAASKGSLSVPPREMIEILVYLANYSKIFCQQAQLTLAGWDEEASRAVASEPTAPREVLEYLISPKNLRPVLLPVLLENPSVTEESLVELAHRASHEIAEVMLKSQRVNQSPKILDSLKSNPHVSEMNAESIENALAPAPSEMPNSQLVKSAAAVAADEILLETRPDETAPDDVLDEGILAYFNEHASEISAEADTAFQPIGGCHDEFVPDSKEPLGEVETAAAGTKAAPAVSAAPAKKAPIIKKSHLSPGQERGSALQKIAKLDIKGRIQLAMKGTKEERSLLIRDGTKVVALAVLESPKISDAEVERYASQKNVLEAVLRAIPMKRRFAKHYAIVRNLVFNPRTPLDVALALVKTLMIHDLRNLSGNKEISETVRKLALKIFKQKMDARKD